mgnify:CR=1 FL=1
MALQNFQYDIIMREYSRRQSQVQHDLEERRKEAFIRVPRLLEIDQEVAALSARKARSLLLGESDTVEDLKKDVAALAQERRTLLRSNGFSDDYLEPHYFCPLCQDTGYVDGQKCSCFKKSEVELLYTQFIYTVRSKCFCTDNRLVLRLFGSNGNLILHGIRRTGRSYRSEKRNSAKLIIVCEIKSKKLLFGPVFQCTENISLGAEKTVCHLLQTERNRSTGKCT